MYGSSNLTCLSNFVENDKEILGSKLLVGGST